MLEISVLTAPIKNKIIVSEIVGEGQIEDLEFNIRHKRLTSGVMQEMQNIANVMYEENRKKVEENNKAKKENKKLPHPAILQKNVIAAQLAFLVEDTGLSSNGAPLPPTVETFLLLSINAQTKLLDGIMDTTVVEKKITNPLKDGMSQAGD